jgi:hypothetical protein
MDHDAIDRSSLGKGEYANYFEVATDFVAFLVDCGQVADEHETPKVYSRIVTSPVGALRLVGVLACAVCRYSQRFGHIRDRDGDLPAQVEQMEDALCEYVRRFIPSSECSEEESGRRLGETEGR